MEPIESSSDLFPMSEKDARLKATECPEAKHFYVP